MSTKDRPSRPHVKPRDVQRRAEIDAALSWLTKSKSE
jgi:hypothetical protein